MLVLQSAWSCSDLDQKENSLVFIPFSVSRANEAASNIGDHPLSLSTLGDTAV